MMEEETLDNTMLRFYDKINQNAGERLWMLDIGSVDEDVPENGDISMDAVPYGVIEDKEEDAAVAKRDFEDLKGKDIKKAVSTETKERSPHEPLAEGERSHGKDLLADSSDKRTKSEVENKAHYGNSRKIVGQKSERAKVAGFAKSGSTQMSSPVNTKSELVKHETQTNTVEKREEKKEQTEMKERDHRKNLQLSERVQTSLKLGRRETNLKRRTESAPDQSNLVTKDSNLQEQLHKVSG